MVQGLRQEYPKDVYFGLFENSKVGEAYKIILNRLDVNADGAVSENEKRGARILLFGHSWGASAVVKLSRRLEREGVPVMLTVQVDSVAKPFQNDRVIPPNVLQAVNFYQTRGLIHGRTRISAADPSRTAILGNFRSEYKNERAECRNFSWYSRVFTNSHIAIECDPQVWSQVKTLLRRSLPNPALTQADSHESDLPPSANECGASQTEVYERLELGDFEAVREALVAETKRRSGYKAKGSLPSGCGESGLVAIGREF